MTRLTLGHARARELIREMRKARVLVVGDLMLDRYVQGTASRISPEAPVPVVKVKEESRALGGAANVAANVVALGAVCDVVGCVGADEDGEKLTALLEESWIGRNGVLKDSGRPTTVKTRIMARHQHLTRVDREETVDVSPDMARKLANVVGTLARTFKSLALEDYNKGVFTLPVIRRTLHAGEDHGLPVVVDPKRRRFFEFQGASVFKPNAVELEAAMDEPVRPDDPEWMEEVRMRAGCDTLLLTLGEEGMAISDHLEGHLRIPTVARDVYDVSGAGDVVTAIMATAMAVGATSVEAAILANRAAMLKVGKVGVRTVTARELADAFDESDDNREGTMYE